MNKPSGPSSLKIQLEKSINKKIEGFQIQNTQLLPTSHLYQNKKYSSMNH